MPLLQRSAHFLKSLVHSQLRARGYELRPLPQPPTLLDDPREAFRSKRAGETVAFQCPVDHSLMYNGLSFDPTAWHPFVATLKAYEDGTALQYDGSPLQAYYQAWQPEHAREALIGCPSGPKALTHLPAYTFYVPWLLVRPDERRAMVKRGIDAFYEGNGLDPDSSFGYLMHGPVSQEFGELEYERLVTVYDSLKANGYDRRHGDIVVTLLQRDGELRFGVEHGNHRVAAMAALGYDTIPARYVNVRRIDRAEAPHWPQVRRGFWDVQSATAYFDHLFDFDQVAWARTVGAW